MTDGSDLGAKLQAVIWHGQDASGDGRAWLADLIASGDHSLVPRATKALHAFVALRNFYGRDLMAELLIGLLGVAAFPAVMDAWSVDIGDDRDTLTAMVCDLIDGDPRACLVTVRELVASDDREKRSAGVWALGFTFPHVGISPDDYNALEAAAGDPDADLRATALGTLS